MGINVTKARIPVVFELNDDSDSRFKKVKVWIAHTGENLNNSYFSKETLEDMSATLGKIPIVGYIEADETGESDFSDHRQEIIIKSGAGVDVRYVGHAYGFIPEDNNAKFETRDGKEWLTAEGYIWTKFKDATEIFSSTNGVKSQSMEITEAEGEVDDIGRMVINSAVFSALCILGEEVPPAMSGSTIEFFNKKENQYQFELDEMIEEFKREKGELELPENKEILETTEVEEVETIEEVQEVQEAEVEVEEVENEEFSVEEVEETELQENTEEALVVEEVLAEVDEVEEPEQPVEPKMFSIEGDKVSFNFQLSHEDQKYGLYKKLEERIERGYVYILETFKDHAIVEQISYDEEWEEREAKILRVNFKVEADEVLLGDEEEVFPMFLTASEKVTIDNQREEIEELNNRLEELTEYKEKSELISKEELVSEYATELDEDVVNSIRENFSAMSVEEVEKEVALQFFKKAQAEKKVVETSVGVQNFSKTKEARYGSLDKYFTK